MDILTLEFTATESLGWPKIKLYIDEDLYEDYIFQSDYAKVNVPLDLMDGPHTLKIELYDKHPNSTVLVDGNIVSDQTVTLMNLYVDDVLIPDLIKYKGNYVTPENTYPQALTWALNNAYWELHFMSPFKTWVLDEKLNHNMKTGDLYSENYSEERQKVILEKIEKIEALLQDVKV
jgi:hypothetical protein